MREAPRTHGSGGLRGGGVEPYSLMFYVGSRCTAYFMLTNPEEVGTR